MKHKRFVSVLTVLVICIISLCPSLFAHAGSTKPQFPSVFQGAEGQGAVVLDANSVSGSESQLLWLEPLKLSVVWYDDDETIYFATQEGWYLLYKDVSWNGRGIFCWGKGAAEVELLWMDIPYTGIDFDEMMQSLMEGIPPEHIWSFSPNYVNIPNDAWQSILGKGEEARGIFASTLYDDIEGALEINETCTALIGETAGIFLVNPTLPSTKLIVTDDMYADETLIWFQVANADIIIEQVNEDLLDTETVADVRSVGSWRYNLKTLAQDGRVANLTDSQAIRDAWATYYPRVQEMLLFEGGIYAVPLSLGPRNAWYIDKVYWYEIGLERIPTTMDELFEDLMDMIAKWKRGEIYSPDIEFVSVGIKAPGVFYDWMLREYVWQRSGPDAALRFDTEEFEMLMDYTKAFYEAYDEAATLEAARAIERSPGVELPGSGGGAIAAGWDISPALSNGLLPIDAPKISAADEPTKLYVGTYLLAVDALSFHKEEAIRLLEFMITYPYLPYRRSAGAFVSGEKETWSRYSSPGSSDPDVFMDPYFKQLEAYEAGKQLNILNEAEEVQEENVEASENQIDAFSETEIYQSEMVPYFYAEEPWQSIYRGIAYADVCGDAPYAADDDLSALNNILYRYATGEKTKEEVIEGLNRWAETQFALYQSRKEF